MSSTFNGGLCQVYFFSGIGQRIRDHGGLNLKSGSKVTVGDCIVDE